MRFFRRFKGDEGGREVPREIRLWGVKVATVGVAESDVGGLADGNVLKLVSGRVSDGGAVELAGIDAVRFVELVATHMRRRVDEAVSAAAGGRCAEARRKVLDAAEKASSLLSRLGEVKADMLADYIIGAGDMGETEKVEQAIALLRRVATAAWAALARVEFMCGGGR